MTVKEIIDFQGLEFEEPKRRSGLRPEMPVSAPLRRRREKPSLTKNLRNFFSMLLG